MISAYQQGERQRDRGPASYANPFSCGEPDFCAFAQGWSHRDAALWAARCELKARAHPSSI